jgi:predicted ATPase
LHVEEILPEDDYNSQNIRLSWREKGHNNYHLDVGQMSDGTLRALALITLIEQPRLPEVICIDEPELGLHPEAIKLLGDLIAPQLRAGRPRSKCPCGGTNCDRLLHPPTRLLRSFLR